MMTSESSELTDNNKAAMDMVTIRRNFVSSTSLDILTNIYHEEVNIAIWERDLSDEIKLSVSGFLKSNTGFEKSMTVSPNNTFSSLNAGLGKYSLPELNKNITELVDMFCCLFDLKRAGLRMTVLDKAMCPKFHVDRVPCRLVSTFQGEATEWLPHDVVNRDKLGIGSEGLADHDSGLYQSESQIRQLKSGDVALLKGEAWIGNENAGLVHRSPSLSGGEKRLLLTLDFSG